MLLHLCVCLKHKRTSTSAAKLFAQTFTVVQFHVLALFCASSCLASFIQRGQCIQKLSMVIS